jgi:hypothetical protein
VSQDKTPRIKTVTEEMVGQGADQDKKLVVWFDNSKKGLALNRTNNRTIRGAYGDDVAGWTGQLIVLYPTSANFRGRQVPALRVRIPPKKTPQQAPAKVAPLKPAKTKPAPASAPEPEENFDFDDEIPA